jgi:RNA ligase (TIGR02306 family)
MILKRKKKMERKLASIQKVIDVRPIFTKDGEPAESIEQITILGWRLVAKKGQFNVDDLAIYFETDSILHPNIPWFMEHASFMETKKWHVKVMKLNNMRVEDEDGDFLPVISQGLALPIEILHNITYLVHNEKTYDDYVLNTLNDPTRDNAEPIEVLSMLNLKVNRGEIENGIRNRIIQSLFVEGCDVTDFLNVTKYEPPIKFKDGDMAGNFPMFIPKTDEPRIQSVPEVINEFKGRHYAITLKYDGTSLTAWYDSESLHVASRNFERKNDGNVYWQMALKYKLDEILANNPNYAIQGEVVGENIQGNLLGIKGLGLYIFNIFNIESGAYMSLPEQIKFCEDNKLNHVEVLETGSNFNYTLEELEAKAKGVYDGTTNPREGIVVRGLYNQYSKWLLGRYSFKVISTDYLLKKGE